MKKTILICCFAVLSACSEFDVAHFLNDAEIISETNNPEPTLSARLFKLREFGECDNGKCPKETIYIAVSEFGEYPDQNYYQTKPSEKWEFVEWEYIPKLEDKVREIKLKIKSTTNDVQVLYRVTFNLNKIKYETLQNKR